MKYLLSLLLTLSSFNLFAGNHSFSAGQVIDATKINQNFNRTYSCSLNADGSFATVTKCSRLLDPTSKTAINEGYRYTFHADVDANEITCVMSIEYTFAADSNKIDRANRTYEFSSRFSSTGTHQPDVAHIICHQ